MYSDALSSAGEMPQSTINGNENVFPDTCSKSANFDRRWMEKYKSLAAYKEGNGHCNITMSHEDKSLAYWVSNQRSFQQAGNLRNDREQLLNDLGFVWRKRQHKTNGRTDEQWMGKYKRLVAFHEKNGHVQVSAEEDKTLATWVANLRLNQRSGMLRKDREKLLNDIQFDWDENKRRKKKKKTSSPWMDTYKRLVAFHERNGHFQVSAAEDKHLSLWIANQRSYQRAGTLQQDREQLLNDLEFVWRSPESCKKQWAELWMDKYKRLVAFHEHNGHFRVTPADKELISWVKNQRIQFKAGSLHKHRQELLDKIGFVWNYKTNNPDSPVKEAWEPPAAIESFHRDVSISETDDDVWMSQFRLLCYFKKTHGHTDVPSKGNTSELALWLDFQLCCLGRGRLSDEKKTKLLRVITAEIPTVETPAREYIPSTTVAVTATTLGTETPVLQSSHHLSTSHGTEENVLPAAVISSSTPEKPINEKETNGDTLSELASSQEYEASAIDQKFAIGTRIHKLFENDGVMQSFGGKVVAFERFKEEDGSQGWGYLIHYDDGDQEHMLETDVAKLVVGLKSKKRKEKGLVNSTTSKRVKAVVASVSETTSTSLNKEKAEKATMKTKSASSARKKERKSNSSFKTNTQVQSRSSETLHDEGSPRIPRMSEKRFRATSVSKTHLSRGITPYPPAESHAASTSDNELQVDQYSTKSKGMDSAFLDNEQIHFTSAQSTVRKVSDAKETEDELIAESTIACSAQAPNKHSSIKNTVDQRFPNGTRISRIFLDMSDNGRAKPYGGKIVDFVYLDEVHDWFYFVQYDDGDTELMDEWEVTKFSARVP